MKDESYQAPLAFIDLNAQQKLIRPKLDAAISAVLDHGQYIMGPEVREFESRLSIFANASHAITCANGTDALSIVLMGWGVGVGDAVFVPSFTYVASAEAPAQLGAIPFFVDVLPDSFNIDPDSLALALSEARELGLNPKAVIAVDLFGQPANIDSITEIAKKEGLRVLVDGAQSFGGSNDGRKVGSMGDATTTSFFPAKPLGCYGDGGAIFTNSDEEAELFRSIRLHGKGTQKYDNVRVGMNSRLDTLQAAVLMVKLDLLANEVERRQEIADLYSSLLSDWVCVPRLSDKVKSAWAQYTIQIESRDEVQAALRDKNIPTIVYYPIPLHRQDGYSHYPMVSSGLPVSDRLSRQVLSLPMFPYIENATVELVASSIIETISENKDHS
ncbi:putative PLP-dependent enzyme possibly involved in cell wall biogenesis [gamma proteobacterium HIMB55]|nr:putative PLP-dependent enzyme possibly involved in cell wall biogenesis [gamma proteobacterium HIMB55]